MDGILEPQFKWGNAIPQRYHHVQAIEVAQELVRWLWNPCETAHQRWVDSDQQSISTVREPYRRRGLVNFEKLSVRQRCH